MLEDTVANKTSTNAHPHKIYILVSMIDNNEVNQKNL
jgi:hypothetical protein